jgi:hypothetical protein
MKFIVMGGAGDVGSRTVEDLAASEGVERVTIADRNKAAAEILAKRLKYRGPQVDVRQVDANDHGGLVEAMRGYDVAASALGPFHRYEAKLVRAAIEAGTDYASVCDDWNAAEAVMDDLDGPAKAKGVTVLSGLGSTPGFSNVAVRYLSQTMDRVRRANVYCFQPLNAGGGEAVFRHMLFVMSGRVVVWRDGKRQMVPACSEQIRMGFPRFGEIDLWIMGHGEPVTIPRFFPGIEEVNYYMGFGAGSRSFVWPAKMGVFDRGWGVEAAMRIIEPFEEMSAGGEPAEGAVRIDVWGETNGKEVHRMICGIGQMREATGLSLSVGTQMVANRELLHTEGGSFAPEGILEPKQFIVRMRTKGLEAWEDLAMTKAVG